MSFGKFFKAVGKLAAAVSAPPKPKTYPVMTMDMITPVGQPITTAQAVKLFKQYMLKVGYLGKDELTEHAGYFSNDLKTHAEELAEAVAYERERCADEVASLKEDIADLKADKKKAKTAEEKAEADDDITSTQQELDGLHDFLNRAIEDQKAFKADKRQFLIDYVNAQVQGS